MGRKKITITRIQDERNRQITFSKRKAGLLKKAYELSILCDVEIAVIMITSNKKLYQYASSNMNSILIRYTEFKDPDESKTNADILDDITKKEKGGGGGHDESGDEDSAHTNFLVTPHTQENFRKIDEEFDHLLRQNQIPPQPQPVHGIQTPLGSAPASMNVPAVMPVSVPVSSTSSVHRTIHQHLKGQMQQLESQRSSGSSAGPLSSGPMSANSSVASLFSPQSVSDLSSGSPAGPGGKTGQRSPMPPPQNTPTRLQTIRNQTLKLHLPGSGRNYISLPGPGSGKGGSEEGGANQNEGMDDAGEEVEGQDDGAGGGADKGNRPGAKPQLRVYIPGQKEFVPRTQATSPLAPVGLSTPAGGGGGVTQAPAVAGQTTTNAESLTTPILSLTTPNVFSSLPPLFSSIMGDFPFGQLPPGGASAGASTAVGAGGNPGGGGDGSSAALVAFPVSIQPSASGAGMGNIVLQAQNMGQPFLLTPTYDRSTNPLLNSQGPPSSLAGAGGGSGGGGGAGGVVGQNSMRDLEQLKQQYERTTQIIQQQLLLSQMTSMMQQQQQQQHSQQTQQASQHHRPPGGQGASTVTEETQDGDVDVGGGRQMETGGISVSATTLAGRGGGETDGGGGQGGPGGGSSSGAAIMREGGLGTSRETDAEIQANQFINGSDVMIGSRSQSDSLLRRTREGRDLGGEDLTSKRPRLDTSVSAL